jgi:predicted RNA methylase
LWFFAIFLWASKCIFIEKNPVSFEISKNLAKYLWFFEKCIFLLWDASEIEIKEKYDLIISETIVTAFLEEDFPLIIKNLKKGDVKIIPERFIFYFEWCDEKWILVENKEIEIISEKIDWKINFDFRKEVKNVKITTKVFLYDDVFVRSWDCISFVNERRVEV